MPSYRFCRPDDVPLLVEAVNVCYDVHFPGTEPLTYEGFRAEMKELDVWPSNSMVALSGEDPVAVLIGTKREDEVLVLRIGVDREHQRQGHALHLLTSLSQKLAVLGPPRLVAEVPLDLEGVPELFRAAGFSPETTLTDYELRGDVVLDSVPDELVIPVSFDDLDASDALAVPDGVAWERSRRALEGRAGVLEGVAIATPVGIDAYLLIRTRGDGGVDVLSASCREASQAAVYLGLLVRWLIGHRIDHSRRVRFPRLCCGEVPDALLGDLGFEAVRRYERYAATATRA